MWVEIKNQNVLINPLKHKVIILMEKEIRMVIDSSNNQFFLSFDTEEQSKDHFEKIKNHALQHDKRKQ